MSQQSNAMAIPSPCTSPVMKKQNSQQTKAPSYRQSCDSCQASKVRCSKERPTCMRCAKHRIDCIYSMSRRAGRPRPRKVDSTTSPTNGSTTDSSQACESQLPIGNISGAIPPTPTSLANEDSEHCSVPSTHATPGPLSSALIEFSSNGQHVKAQHIDAGPNLPEYRRHLKPPVGTSLDFDLPSIPPVSLAEFKMSPLQYDSSSGLDDFMLEPLQNFGDMDDLYTFRSDHLQGGSDASPTSMNATMSNTNEDYLADWTSSLSETCHCSATLVRHFAEMPIPVRTTQEDRDFGESVLYATAVQKSKILLDQSFRVLCCTQCGPNSSSALVICHAIDEISISLGMGTLWAEVSSDRLPLGTAIARDELLLRFGSYSVRGADQRVLLRALVLKRLNEMQRVIRRLHQIILQGSAANSPCYAICADMISELSRNVTARIGLLKILVR